MGLDISVGMLADLVINDEEGAEWLRKDIEKLNKVLVAAGLAAHIEPTETDSMSIGTYGYSGLHYLRRCAAHLHFTGALPPPLPADANAALDDLYARYGAEFEAENVEAELGTFARASSRRFDHLILHDDAEGLYVPQRFDRVIIAGDQAYGWIGSSYALIEECERLASALGLPAHLFADGEDETFIEAIEAERKAAQPSLVARLFRRAKTDGATWRAHPIAAMMCAKLHNMASLSVRTGSLMVFC